MDISIFGEPEPHKLKGHLDEEEENRLKLFGGGTVCSSLGFTIQFTDTEPRPLSSRPAMGHAQITGANGKTYTVPYVSGHAAATFIQRNKCKAPVGNVAAEFQLYMEHYGAPMERGAATVACREGLFADDQGPVSFGSKELGGDPLERAAFWLALDAFDLSPTYRLQHRLTAEIPWELRFDPGAVRKVLESFCNRVFEPHGIVYWTCVHEPDVANGADPRNLHVHIVFADRKVTRVGDWQWEFAKRKIRVIYGKLYPWGTEAPSPRLRRLEGKLGPILYDHMIPTLRLVGQVHRYLRNMDRDEPFWGHRSWPWQLRYAWLDVCNRALWSAARRGLEITRLYDPYSYELRGVAKSPTEHLGQKRSSAERKGILTAAGIRNRIREQVAAKEPILRALEELFLEANVVVDAAYDPRRSELAVRARRQGRNDIAEQFDKALVAAADAIQAVSVDLGLEYEGLEALYENGSDPDLADPEFWRLRRQKSGKTIEHDDIPYEPAEPPFKRWGEAFTRERIAETKDLLAAFDKLAATLPPEPKLEVRKQVEPAIKPETTAMAASSGAAESKQTQPSGTAQEDRRTLTMQQAPTPSIQSASPKASEPLKPATPSQPSNPAPPAAASAPEKPAAQKLPTWTFQESYFSWSSWLIEREIKRTGYVLSAKHKESAYKEGLPAPDKVAEVLEQYSPSELQGLYWTHKARLNSDSRSDDGYPYSARVHATEIFHVVAREKKITLREPPSKSAPTKTTPGTRGGRPGLTKKSRGWGIG